MKKNKLVISIFCAFLTLIIFSSVLTSCAGSGEESTSTTGGTSDPAEIPEEFDYESADISQYISLSKSDYTGTVVTLKDIYTVTEADIDEQLDTQRFKNKFKTNGDTQVTDQPIKLGDSAFIYYTGYLDGVPFNGGSNADSEKPYELSIGSGSFIPGFEEGLIGVIPNETSKETPYDLNVSFPEDYSNSPDLAGKAVVFKVWIEYVVQYTIPEFDDSYVSETLKYDGTAAQYKQYIIDTMQKNLDESKKNQAVADITAMLIEKSTVLSYPEQSVNYWYASYVSECKYYMSYYSSMGYSFSSFDEFAKTFFGINDDKDWKTAVTELAQSTVHEKLVFYAVAELEGVEITEEDIAGSIEYFIEYYKEQTGKTYTADEIKANVEEAFIRERVIYTKVSDILYSNCTVNFGAVTE